MRKILILQKEIIVKYNGIKEIYKAFCTSQKKNPEQDYIQIKKFFTKNRWKKGQRQKYCIKQI